MSTPKFRNLLKVTEPNEDVNTYTQVGDLVSQLSSQPEKKIVDIIDVRVVPRRKIEFNKKNDYKQTEIEKLADSILHYGLQNIPSGYYDEDIDRYVLENGERRTRAIDYLINKYSMVSSHSTEEEYILYTKNVKKYEKGYPFHINEVQEEPLTELEEIDHELRLIDCNIQARNDPSERAQHVQRSKELLERRKELTGEQININKEIASSMGISERQVQKYNAANTLIPELKIFFEQKDISLNDAEYYASLPPEDQKRIVGLLMAGEAGNAKKLQKLNEELKNMENEKKRELEDYERKIAALKKEKDEKEASVAVIIEAVKTQAENEKRDIQAQLEAEYRKDLPDHGQIEALKAELGASTDKYDNAVKELEKERVKAKEKDREIKQLKKQLGELAISETVSSGANVNDTERLKAIIEVDTGYNAVLKSAMELKKLCMMHHTYLDTEKIKGDMEKLVTLLKTIS